VTLGGFVAFDHALEFIARHRTDLQRLRGLIDRQSSLPTSLLAR
jgi:hypothetical protein